VTARPAGRDREVDPPAHAHSQPTPVSLSLLPAGPCALACQSSLAAVEPGGARGNRRPCAGDRLSGKLLPGCRSDPGETGELVDPRLALVSSPLALVSHLLALVSGPLALVSHPLALVTGLVTRVLRPVTLFGVHTYKDAARCQTAASRQVAAPTRGVIGRATRPAENQRAGPASG
jgi:hypothetical protein